MPAMLPSPFWNPIHFAARVRPGQRLADGEQCRGVEAEAEGGDEQESQRQRRVAVGAGRSPPRR
jgi:hypothetical protein